MVVTASDTIISIGTGIIIRAHPSNIEYLEFLTLELFSKFLDHV